MAYQKFTATILSLYLLIGVDCDLTAPPSNTSLCHTCFFVDNCYNLTYLLELDANFRSEVVIRKMEILRSRNQLFYSYEPIIEDPEYYQVAFLNLDNPHYPGIISSRTPDGRNGILFNFGTLDIDQENDSIYLGGSEGVFKLDARGQNFSFYSSIGDSITNLVYKSNVFFTKHPENIILEKRGDNFLPVKYMEEQPVKIFMIDKTNAFVYMSTQGLFVARNGVKSKISNNSFFRGMALDTTGTVYLWWIDSIYVVKTEKNITSSRLVKVFDMPRVKGVAFDRDNNMIVALDKNLFKIEVVDGKYCK